MPRFLLLLLLPALIACAEAPAAPLDAPRLPQVRVASVSSADTGPSVRLHGLTRARSEADLSFAVAGRIAAVNARLGETVRAGAPVASLDLRPLRRRVDALDGQLADLDAALEQGRRDLVRAEQLAAEGAVTSADLEQARTGVQRLEANRRALDAQRGEAAWALEQGSLKSPFDAVVTARFVEPGEVAGNGRPVVSLRALDGIEVEVALPEQMLRSVQVGDPVTVAFPLAGIPERSATVVAVGQAAAEPFGLFPAVVALESAADLRPGLSASITFEGPAAEGWLVPVAALVAPAGREPRVRRVRNGTVEEVPVEPQAMFDDAVAVLGDLSADDQLVISGHVGLVAGTAVEVRQ